MISPLRNLPRCLKLLAALLPLFLLGSLPARAASATTTTVLTVTAGGSPVTTVPTNTAVTFTATVTSSGTPITHGLVNFCDASAAYCADVHILGSAALTASGSATWKFIPGPGAHTYKAVFQPTAQYASSTSSAASLSVSGKVNTATSFVASGTPGAYTLTSTVISAGPQPTGTISFNDATNENTALASAALTANSPGFIFSFQNKYTGTASAIADVNNDGIPDLIVGYHYTYPDGATCDASFNPNLETTDRGAIYLGNGDGFFTHSGTDFPVTCQPTYISVADFNSDGFPDLAFSSAYTAGFTSDNLLFGDGAGNFARKTSSDLGLLGNILVADFNQDGFLDIASVTSQNVTVYLGDGAGNFASKVGAAAGATANSAATGDFNSDGIPDIAIITSVVIGSDTTQQIQLLLGAGDGTFTPSTSYPPISGMPQALLVADFNNDGKADLAVSIFSDPAVDPNANSSSITILTGDGAGNFTSGAPLVLQDPANANISFALGDFNNDGTPDLVAGPTSLATSSTPPAKVFLGTGGGTFSTQTATYAGLPASVSLQQSFAIGDLNGDGIPDLLNGNGYEILIANQSATATANSVATPSGSGSHQVFASYSGDSNYLSSSSTSLSLDSTKGTPQVALTASSNPAVAGQPLTLTATITGPGLVPTGTVNFLNGATSLGTATLANGVAALTLPAPAAGSYSLTAAYAGDSNYSSVTSQPLSLTTVISLPVATITATPTNATSYVGSSYVVNITASGPSGSPTPTGTVTLSGSRYISDATALVNGAAAITIPANALPIGNDVLVLFYSGDSAYGGSSSRFQIIVTNTPSGVTLAPASTTITLAPGATANNTVPITITPTEGFTGSVTLSAAITSSPAGAVNPPTLSLGSPGPITFDGKTAATTATLTISTTAPTTAANTTPSAPFAIGGSALACLAFFFLVPARKRRLRSLFALLFCLGLYAGVTACGGSSSSGGNGGGNGGGKSTPGTTPGAYQITVTATATSSNNSAAAPLSATIITLTVQ